MGVKVLSLFDGMACGMIAFKQLGIEVDEYHAYEIDKYTIQVSKHNFPEIIHHGDVFEGNFTEYRNFDYLIGGSPCTYWSIAQFADRRETVASGMGWELFSQYVRALHEAKPKYFLYENNKSMSNEIYKSISETFGFEPIMINSALVSAQNRQRYYWVGKRNLDGSYSKVDIKQPEDRGILLRDVIDGMTDREKGRAIIGSTGRTTHREYFKKSQGNMVYEPVVKPRFHAIHVEFENKIPIKAISETDGKTYSVYCVADGKITIKGQNYPVKLVDGYYIIRKLTVNECKRLQTVPDWFEFPVSDTQAYKCLGNGWTVEVIVYLLRNTLEAL